MLLAASESFWVAPEAIEYKITPFLDLGPVEAGEWDLERRKPFKATAKCRAIVQRFTEGRDWIETDLFADVYARRLAKDGRIGSCRSLSELAAEYERRIDKLYASMKRDGFRTEIEGRKLTLPVFLIGRGGEVFIGNQGNHRLAIAQVLGLEKIAGRIVCRYKSG